MVQRFLHTMGMANINAHRKGQQVTLTGKGRTRRISAEARQEGSDLSWDDEGYYTDDFTGPLQGTVRSVESHGSAPYTRYSVVFADGTATSGLAEGTDIEFAR